MPKKKGSATRQSKTDTEKNLNESYHNQEQSSTDGLGKDGRGRNFATVIYPESAPSDWCVTLADFKIPCFISPLHDRDKNPNGEPKKAHYHIMMMFDNKKSPEQVREYFDKIGGVGLESIGSLRGYGRYLCHLDNPEKAQYSQNDVVSFGGADYHQVCSLPSDKHKIIREMVSWCKESNCTEFADLYEYAMEYQEDWFICLTDSCAYVMEKYLKSKHWKDSEFKAQLLKRTEPRDCADNKEGDLVDELHSYLQSK